MQQEVSDTKLMALLRKIHRFTVSHRQGGLGSGSLQAVRKPDAKMRAGSGLPLQDKHQLHGKSSFRWGGQHWRAWNDDYVRFAAETTK